jgi:adenosylcobinamide kinase/adenosylcobinamide-phosphate guanylyltransferase
MTTNLNHITLILGGARSGKSSYAQKLAEDAGKSVTFLATAQALDEEMSIRIRKYRSERPESWQTLEIPFDIALQVQEIKSEIIVLDCITLLASNLLMQFVKDDLVDEQPFMQAVQGETDDAHWPTRASHRRRRTALDFTPCEQHGCRRGSTPTGHRRNPG